MDQRGCQGPGASEGARRATGDDPGMVSKGSKRFSARRKGYQSRINAVLRAYKEAHTSR